MSNTTISRWALAFAALSTAGLSGMAVAQDDKAIEESLFSTMMAEDAAMFTEVGLYTLDNGNGFTLDRSERGKALLKLDGQDEVLALSVVQGPRGDEFLKSDTDETIVRVTHLGNVIFYSDDAPEGAPAQLGGAANDIQPPHVDEDFESGFGAYAAVQLQRPVEVDLVRLEGDDRAWVQDAARLTINAVMSSGKAGAAITALSVETGAEPGVSVTDADGLIVTIVPDRGYAGRLSSERLMRAIEAGTPAS